MICLLGLTQTGCQAPIGAEKSTPARTYHQTHDNPVSHGELSEGTKSVLHRFEQQDCFNSSPDETLALIQKKALESGDRDLLFALSELNYVTAENLRRSVKAWETRDSRDYYLASSVFAWLFLFGNVEEAKPSAFDQRFRQACDLYNYGLGWALIPKGNTNGTAVLAGGLRRLPFGEVNVEFDTHEFPWELEKFESFAVADHFLIRGLTVRNRQAGLGAPLVGTLKPEGKTEFKRAVPATVFLRIHGELSDIPQGRLRASLELYSPFDDRLIKANDQSVPLETDTTIATAYLGNQSLVWQLGMAQFFSPEEKIPTDVYLSQPYRRGRIPVVFVHGTFSSPVWWAEMSNTLSGDPVLSRKYQFWFFIYNSGNPLVYSATKLREALEKKVKELDPEARDPALNQMVVIGHSQGGLLTKLTATPTGDKLLQAVLKTNQPENLKIPQDEMRKIRQFTCFEPLPFVKRVVFIATPHRGSYAAGSLVRSLARKFVTLPSSVVKVTTDLSGLTERLKIPSEIHGGHTSLDGMSPRNPMLRALADLPVAPGVKANSIIAVRGGGDFHQGRDGLVKYESAHVDYVESEHIVRSFHSCLAQPATIEEVRRILHEHLKSVPAKVTAQTDSK
jgi:pimeloyl-ACP methyl ester carboxylesterase